jgi:hypothetical protein
LEELRSGDLVCKINRRKSLDQYAIFLGYGKNAAQQQHESLSVILLDNSIIQVPTVYIRKFIYPYDTTL